MLRGFLMMLLCACMMQTTQANDFNYDHDAWDVLLKRHVVDIEHGLIRGSTRYNDPRIHFTINCASVGCPALNADAYRGPGRSTGGARRTWCT